MVNNKKLKGKHRRQTTADLFMPAPPPPAAVPKKYGLDYARFDAVDSDDSDAERQALAAPEALRRGRAPPTARNASDLERELGAHVSSLSAREALSAARTAEAEMRQLKKQLAGAARGTTKKASARETAARRAIAEAKAQLETAKREAGDARAKAETAARSVRSRSDDVSATQARARELGAKVQAATAALDPDVLRAGIDPAALQALAPEAQAAPVVSEGTIDVASTVFKGRELVVTVALDPPPDEDAGLVVTLRDAAHLSEDPLVSEYVEAHMTLALSEAAAACAHHRRLGDRRAATRSTCPVATVLSCRLETRAGVLLREAPRVVCVDWTAKSAALWGSPSTGAVAPLVVKKGAARPAPAPAPAPKRAAAAAAPTAKATVGGFATKANRQAMTSAAPAPPPPPPAAAPSAPLPPPAAPPSQPRAPTTTAKPPYTFAGGRVEHLPGIRTFVLTLPDGRGELSVDGDRVELASPAGRETLRLPAQLDPDACQASKVKLAGAKHLRVRLPYGQLRRLAPGARADGATTVVFADHASIPAPPETPACRACTADLAPPRQHSVRVRDGDLDADEVTAALTCDTASPVLESAHTIPVNGERFVGRCSLRLCAADTALLKIGPKTLEVPRGLCAQSEGRLARRLHCPRCDQFVGFVFGGVDAALYRHRLAHDEASPTAFVAAFLAREASASNATAFRLVCGNGSMGVRVLASGGHAAALGQAKAGAVVALSSTLSCSFRRDAPPSSTLVDVALEDDELAAVVGELEAAASGVMDGGWRLATWAPRGFADAPGGF